MNESSLLVLRTLLGHAAHPQLQEAIAYLDQKEVEGIPWAKQAPSWSLRPIDQNEPPHIMEWLDRMRTGPDFRPYRPMRWSWSNIQDLYQGKRIFLTENFEGAAKDPNLFLYYHDPLYLVALLERKLRCRPMQSLGVLGKPIWVDYYREHFPVLPEERTNLYLSRMYPMHLAFIETDICLRGISLCAPHQRGKITLTQKEADHILHGLEKRLPSRSYKELVLKKMQDMLALSKIWSQRAWIQELRKINMQALNWQETEHAMGRAVLIDPILLLTDVLDPSAGFWINQQRLKPDCLRPFTRSAFLRWKDTDSYTALMHSHLFAVEGEEL